ncbi:IclR family transcriptional regulator [Novosphingobium sp. M1R2S20]|uniref:IclR family transcriptional regulator n=1 Tax=Novosphingobium rhizovicinum TaxID=3228928 RepID=A0ABV3REE4_9SPHN
MVEQKPDSEGNEAATGARAILRVPEVLMALSANRAGRTFADLSENLDLPRSSLHRMLRTLEQGGYVINTQGTYRLGPQSAKLARMMNRALPTQGFPDIARPVLEDLARRTGESVILALLDDHGRAVFYVDVINSNAALRVMVPQGNVRPLHSASTGKAILAYLPASALKEYLAIEPWELFTEETTRREALRGALAEVRARGIAFDRNGSFSGASGFAVPCFDATGAVHCAISVAGPTDRVERARADIEHALMAAGEQLSRALGYEGAYPLVAG